MTLNKVAPKHNTHICLLRREFSHCAHFITSTKKISWYTTKGIYNIFDTATTQPTSFYTTFNFAPKKLIWNPRANLFRYKKDASWIYIDLVVVDFGDADHVSACQIQIIWLTKGHSSIWLTHLPTPHIQPEYKKKFSTTFYPNENQIHL